MNVEDENKSVRRLSRSEVAYSELKDGRKGVSLAEGNYFLHVWRKGKWHFKLYDSDCQQALTGTFTLKSIEGLKTSPKATGFRSYIRHNWSNPHEIVEWIIAEIEEHLDEWLEPQLKNVKVESQEEERETVVYPPDIEQKVEDEVSRILNAENQLEALKPHLDNVICGEEGNKQAILVLLSGSKYEDFRKKAIVLLKGTEGGGKSTLATELSRPFKTKEVGRFSSHALDYTNLEGYEILYLKELGSMDLEKQGVSTLKFLSADDRGYTVEITVRDSETGEFTTKTYQIPAITVISTTTRLILDRQFERRAWLFNVDESKEQTERIKKWKAKQKKQEDEKLLGLRKLTDYEFSREVLRRFIERLTPKKNHYTVP